MFIGLAQLIAAGVTVGLVCFMIGLVLIWMLIRIEERLVRLEECFGTEPKEEQPRQGQRV